MAARRPRRWPRPSSTSTCCPSAIFGSCLGKKELLAQGFLSLETGAEEVTQQRPFPVFSLARVSSACAERPHCKAGLLLADQSVSFPSDLGVHGYTGRDRIGVGGGPAGAGPSSLRPGISEGLAILARAARGVCRKRGGPRAGGERREGGRREAVTP
uniref:60S ribosomal protein L13a isoform X2 n=1 Tax=Sus scrofa TaxID=9823 RepID=A0A480JEG6_PIG